MNWKTTLFSTLALGAFTAFAGEIKSDSWEITKSWKAEEQTVIGEKGAGFLFLKDKKNYKTVEFSAEVTPIKAEATSWKVCGIGIYKAADMFWYIGFVEMPNDMGSKHIFELKEMKGKVWGAETKLKRIGGKTSGQWEYNKTYKFTIKMSEGKIEGSITGDDGKLAVEFAYELTDGEVTEGTPVLRLGNMSAKFNQFDIKE